MYRLGWWLCSCEVLRALINFICLLIFKSHRFQHRAIMIQSAILLGLVVNPREESHVLLANWALRFLPFISEGSARTRGMNPHSTQEEWVHIPHKRNGSIFHTRGMNPYSTQEEWVRIPESIFYTIGTNPHSTEQEWIHIPHKRNESIFHTRGMIWWENIPLGVR